MMNKNCGPDIVKYFIVGPTFTGATGDFSVCNGELYVNTILGCTGSVELNNNIFYADSSVLFNSTITACNGVYTSNIYGCSPITVHDQLRLNSVNNNNINLSKLLGINSTTNLVEYVDLNSIVTNTATTVSDFTYNDANTFTITRNDNVEFSTTINVVTGLTVNGDLNVTGSISAFTYYGDGSNLTGINDYYVTGGTYSNGNLTLNRQNGSFSVSGFSTGYTLTTTDIVNTLGYIPLSAYTDYYVTGGTYSNGDLLLNRQDGSFSISGFSTGYTLTFSEITNVLGYTPLSAYTDYYVTGGTYDNSTGTLTLNRQDDIVLITGFTTGETKCYGSFYDTNNQTGLKNTLLTMSANTTDSWTTGMSLSGGTKFVMDNPGVYDLQFSAQVQKVQGNNTTLIHIWLSQNGNPVPNSAGRIDFPSNSVHQVPSWNYYFETTNPNEYVELNWDISSNLDNAVVIQYYPSNGYIPATPSLIVTINKIS